MIVKELKRMASNDKQKESVESAYKRGFEDALFAYAYTKDGTYYVGTTGRTLKEAKANIENTWNYAP